AVAAGVAGAWLWLARDDGGEKPGEPAPRPERVRNRLAAPSKPAKDLPKTDGALAADERRTVTGRIIKVPKNPFGTPIPKDLEYKAIWEYTPEDYARVDPGYAARHERFLKAQAAIPWKTPSDRKLSLLLFPKDGNMGLLIPFDARFKDKFVESLKTPIEIGPDDSPELREQKKAMIDTRAYLKERMDAGEDIVGILNEEYEKNRRLSGMRENLLKELRALEKTASSVQEVQDYVNAANLMLEREGAGKIGLPLALTRYRLGRQKQSNGDNK
ncbi:MAG: hypothetical protein IJ829_07540, partial [Kiritimatiellae bacterium]|nr:hypothetical protein [Kiritimatiellia bacterium]